MDYIKFSVPGKPFGKQRPRIVNVGGYSRAYTPKETATYENLVKIMYQQAADGERFADDVALRAEITAYYEIPKSTSKKRAAMMLVGEVRPTKKPDLDNIEKIICDSLNGIAYKDDSQIVESVVTKFYSKTPEVVVRITEIKNERST